MPISITPLTEALGVAITGVDLSKPTLPIDLQAMEQALRDHCVIVIRGQKFSPAQYLTAIRLFGDPMIQHLTEWLMPDHPEIAILDSRNIPAGSDGSVKPPGSRDWHTDSTNFAKPPKITALYAVSVPSTGGDTGFANMHMAYNALPSNVQKELGEMKTNNKAEDREYVSAAHKKTSQVHPLIRTHPDTGKKAVYIHPGKAVNFVGMEPAQSLVFMNDLMETVIQPEICYRHKWHAGDLLLCDNRSVMHLAYNDYDHSEGRVMHRVILEGDVPV
jgi:taurine dioxygenase